MDYKAQIREKVNEIKKQGYNKICFWIPAYNVGGGTYYLCEIAKYLVENFDLDIYYMDFPDGYPSSLLKGSNVKILDYNTDDLDFCIKEPCVIVTNSTRVTMLKRMNPANKLLFWHYETVPCGWDSVLIKGEERNFLELTKKENAMVFHDWSSRNIFKQQFNIEFENKSYLYMFVNNKEAPVDNFELINPEEINIVWVGRAGNEKIYSIYNIMDNLAKYPTTLRKVFHIVGDGWRMNDLKKYSERYKDVINFNFTGTIPKTELDDFLKKHADVVFAMGMSAIEGAALRIPSVVVQLDTKPINGSDFYWLFDTKEYCVGILPSQKKDFDIEYTKFERILKDIYLNNQKEYLAKKCYDYYLDTFGDFERIVNSFLSYIIDSTLTAEKLKGCIKYMPYCTIRLVQKKFLNKVFHEEIIYDNKRYIYKNGKFKKTKAIKQGMNK